MRRAVLLKSVQRVMGPHVQVLDAAYVWNRHHWVTPFSLIVLAGIIFLAPVAGIDSWPTRIVLGLAGVGVAVMATTTYHVLALTDRGMVLLDASRIRQIATAHDRDLDPTVSLELLSGTVINSDWKVGDRTYTVPLSSQKAMERMAMARFSD